MKQRFRYVFWFLLPAAAAGAAGPAYADVTVSGNVSPNNPSDPWDLGSTPLVVSSVDEAGGGSVTVTRRGTLITAGAAVGRALRSTGTVEITGYGSTWTNRGVIEVGFPHASGDVLIRRGARVTTDDLVITVSDLATGDVLVEGYDATLTVREDAYVGQDGSGRLTLRQGARFSSDNTYIGLGACRYCDGTVRVEGSATRWVNTGELAVGGYGNGALLIDRGEVSSVNAEIVGFPDAGASHVNVTGWGGTWTNTGLLRIGDTYSPQEPARSGELTVGAYGTVVTAETEILSDLGLGFIEVGGVHASWINRGDVTILAARAEAPSLLVERGGVVRLGGLLRAATPPGYEDAPYLGPAVRLAGGALIAGAIEVEAGGFELAGGRLDTGSFVGDLANTQAGRLVVGEAHSGTGVAGSYSQGPGAALRIAVAGPGAAPLLQIDGDVILDGALEVRPAGEPVSFEAGDSVVLLGWTGALAGTFAAVDIALPLAPGLAWDTSALYTTGEILVVPAS
ncbi:hypothetical protein SOCE26_039650 [Sorangium cellulosum]|uniref:Secreted protein n=1 Tax=Sorangium cellulosum TaxID=56 RepID=A0A2L0ETD1_SORCE|nr:hypothetical protein [Sorangium cellulosum]AUX42532.1 hypothetical protein SOCE26_039650 [Sorangium cellulosum]